MFRTIIAKYAGSTCKRCGATITVGETIRYGGRGRTYHLAAACPSGTGYTDDPPTSHLGNYMDAAEAVETADGAPIGSYGRPSRRTRSTYTRFSSGAEQYTNRAGRCEDAPCCGCCS